MVMCYWWNYCQHCYKPYINKIKYLGNFFCWDSYQTIPQLPRIRWTTKNLGWKTSLILKLRAKHFLHIIHLGWKRDLMLKLRAKDVFIYYPYVGRIKNKIIRLQNGVRRIKNKKSEMGSVERDKKIKYIYDYISVLGTALKKVLWMY